MTQELIANMLGGNYHSSTELAGMQLAVWQIMGGGLEFWGSANHNSAADQAKLMWLNIVNAGVPTLDYTAYMPIPDGSSQRFVTASLPEPSSLLILGIGLLGVGSIGFRRRS